MTVKSNLMTWKTFFFSVLLLPLELKTFPLSKWHFTQDLATIMGEREKVFIFVLGK
jgi:hypothetical protein